jgi:hypothetical protein
MALVWRELFTRAASAEGGASKQLAPQRWPHPRRIIFSKNINAGLNSSRRYAAIRAWALSAHAECQ